jgi:hypothetical protein
MVVIGGGSNMKSFKIVFFLSILITGLLFTQACNKTNNDAGDDIDATEAANEAFADGVFDEFQEITDQAWNEGSSGFKSGNEDDFRLGDCVTVTVDTTSVPRVMTIDFGEENCLCRDGKYRRGQIIVTFTGRFRRPGAVITHTFNNFYVNDNHLQGTKVMTNLGLNEDGFILFSNAVEGSITLIADGNVINWSSDKIRTWVEGFNTPRWVDDVY